MALSFSTGEDESAAFLSRDFYKIFKAGSGNFSEQITDAGEMMLRGRMGNPGLSGAGPQRQRFNPVFFKYSPSRLDQRLAQVSVMIGLRRFLRHVNFLHS